MPGLVNEPEGTAAGADALLTVSHGQERRGGRSSSCSVSVAVVSLRQLLYLDMEMCQKGVLWVVYVFAFFGFRCC